MNYLAAFLGYLVLNIRDVNSIISGDSYLSRNILSFNDNFNNSFQILVYHRILPYDDPFAIGVVTVNNFKKQIEYLKKKFRIISLNKLVEEVKKGSIKPNSLCITFDDGYLDNFLYAFPILKKYDIPATIFLTTDTIGTANLLWFDKVIQIIKRTNIHQINFLNHEFDLTDFNSKKKSWKNILELLKKYPPDERDEYIEVLKDSCKIFEFDKVRIMLNWEEIKDMFKSGMNFGAHTKSHPILTTIDIEKIKNEVLESRLIIENNLDCEITNFAYPNGGIKDFNTSCKVILKKYKFKSAVTTIGTRNSINQDLFELSRFLPWDKNNYAFIGRIIIEKYKNK
ncbi:MAG: polysaccharide deacetylase family protein [Calditrichaeota bacterium]|nr:polysaccharide deacetylase family protein [Calditrichota bacterium]